MADEVLSQSEIDALLSALSSGELNLNDFPQDEDKPKVKLYDFRSPQRFSKEHIRTLELIHENYARIISNYLSAQVRTNVKINVQAIQQIKYDEFIHSLPNSTILMVFKMLPLKGSILFDMSPNFVFQIIDLLLGGNGGGKYKPREFTDIDKNIINQVNKSLISNLKLAWDEILKVEIEIEGLETNPAFNQTLAPNEAVVLITFSVEMGKDNSLINICIPYLSIEKVLDDLGIKYWARQNDDEILRESQEKLKSRLNVVDVSMTALLGSTLVKVDDFLKLSKGDVITLDNKSSSPVSIFVEDTACYMGKPGIIGKKLGVQILDIIDKDVENYE